MSKEIITKNLSGKLEVFNENFEYNQRACRGAVFKIVLNKGDLNKV